MRCFFESFLFVLAAIALSKTLDYYADTESSEMTPSVNESTNDNNEAESDNENDKNSRNLYDKAGKVTKKRSGTNNNNPEGEEDMNIVSANIKTIVVICSKSILIYQFHSNRILQLQ